MPAGSIQVFYFMEIEYARLTSTPSFVRKENKSDYYINQNYKYFLDAYYLVDTDLQKEIQKNLLNIEENKKAFNNKKCRYCDGELKFNSFYKFWGCKNYQNKETLHSNFQNEEPVFFGYTVTCDANWLTKIIEDLGFKNKVKSKELFNFYIDNGLEDLRVKYGSTASTIRINNYTETKKRSGVQEKECLEFLKTKYKKVVYQQCITYKLKDKKESFCIPDFICSELNSVIIVDAKLDVTNDEKMDLYVNLIQHILKEKSDHRITFGAHIFYEGEFTQYYKSHYPVITIKKSS